MNLQPGHFDRRRFLATSAGGVVGIALGKSAVAAAPASAIDTGGVEGGKVTFPRLSAASEPAGDMPKNPLATGDRVGFAVVGLGRLSVNQILPAFGSSKKARLVALVSGTPDKADTLAQQYGVKKTSIYTYENFDLIRNNPEIEVVYIVVPNALHAEYVERAARAGKHVLCEKPMSTGVAEAEKMVSTCSDAKRLLMIAYRCQYEVFNRAAIEQVRKKAFGTITLLEMVNAQNDGILGEWRFNKALAGGGSLPDVGLYCLNGARALLDEEPVEVFARIANPPGDPRFQEVEDTVSFTLRFPSGIIANCASSYSTHEARRLRIYGSDQTLTIENAFGYRGQEMTISRLDEGVESIRKVQLEPKDQFALEMDHMADCVRQNRTPHTPGEEGVQDHRLMEAIYLSAASGRPVTLVPPAPITRGPVSA